MIDGDGGYPGMTGRSLTLSVLDGAYAVCRRGPDDDIPELSGDCEFYSISRAPGEITIVCPEAAAPAGGTREDGWRVLKVEGRFAFSETGILARLAVPLADAGVGIFALSTFDTDYILVKRKDLDHALTVLAAAGHHVIAPVSTRGKARRPGRGESE